MSNDGTISGKAVRKFFTMCNSPQIPINLPSAAEQQWPLTEQRSDEEILNHIEEIRLDIKLMADVLERETNICNAKIIEFWKIANEMDREKRKIIVREQALLRKVVLLEKQMTKFKLKIEPNCNKKLISKNRRKFYKSIKICEESIKENLIINSLNK